MSAYNHLIIVRPNLGLANRMRVLNSCLALSGYSGSKIHVIWEKNKTLNCEFTDIFEPIEKLEIVNKSKVFLFYSCPAPVVERFYRRFYRKMVSTYYSFNNSFFDEQSVICKRFDDNYWKNLTGNIILDTCHDFLSQNDENNFYSSFKPLPEIQKKIDKITEQFNEDVIGVHIRRNDNQLAREISKQEFFVRRLEQALQKNPKAQFFLSTDDISTYALFRSKFGKHIISFDDKILSRNSTEGIQDAVVDLFALSRTKHILGSWWSSFGIIAAIIGKINLEIVKN